MFRSPSDLRGLIALVALGTAGCPEPGVYRRGVNLNVLQFEYRSPTMGVHPDTSVLRDPNNPFAKGAGPETKWDVESFAVPAPRFYMWATALANEPIGENQWYTGNALRDIYNLEQAEAEDLVFVRQLAIDAYQTTLDAFPGSVTFDATGRIPFALGPLAYEGIVSLGGTPVGWKLLYSDDGEAVVVRDAP